MKWVLLSVILINIVFGFPNPEDATITSGSVWYDTSHKEIHAHGGGILYEGGKYYWVGTTQKQGSGWLSEGINLYSSVDLSNWTYVGEIFHNTSIKISTSGPYRIERPKIIYNKQTQKYVMWFHLDTSGFGLQMVGVATSNTISGTYQWVHGFQPDGQPSYDMTIYQDDDGTAYLCRSVSNQYAGISPLTADYLNTAGITSKGPKIEGMAIWKMNNRYYLLGSHLTGWTANQAVLCESNGNSLKGATWQTLPVITSSSTTWNSQSTFVFPYNHPSGKTLYMYMGDRWDYPTVNMASYVWLPLVVNSANSISLPWEASWVIKNY